MDTKQLLEAEMREALGLAPAKPAPKRSGQRPSYIQVELSVRKGSGGPAFRFEHRSRSLSTLEAQLEAEKRVRQKGWEVWAVLDVRQVSE
nr:transposase [Azotobacter chroococcum]